uniref:Uncharacterized protein n=1 Tax=Arundo donax TaxID=35708 RepID=A0A0A9EUD1_ARUDO
MVLRSALIAAPRRSSIDQRTPKESSFRYLVGSFLPRRCPGSRSRRL